MPLSASDIGNRLTLLCPENDLEARAIVSLARGVGVDVRVSNQAWGARLDAEPAETFLRLKPEVCVVEMPGPEREELLRQHGHILHVVDHHGYQWGDDPPLNRQSSLSSLEQVAHLLHVSLTPWQLAVAWNDAGFLWGMLDGGVDYSTARQIRDEARRGTGTGGTWRRLPLDSSLSSAEIWVGSGPHSVHLDELCHMNEDEWQSWRGKGRERAAAEPLRILLDQGLKNAPLGTLTGYGPLARLQRLWTALPRCRARWWGGLEYQGYMGGQLAADLPVDELAASVKRALELEDVVNEL